ncbi:g3901 [Coccomyxa viridis]|uniref:G3901 protein n=1 Tax=Coccomyxa viridis TaxID=1274662 RepID=A0ABP1FNZ9_9CHLO
MPATEQPQTNGQSTITALQDAIYGTRNYTSGARYQLPRKVPLRIEPKTYFANERTLLAWLSMAVTIGSVSAALVGFTASEKDVKGVRGGPVTQNTTNLITVSLLPVAILMIGYALTTYILRSSYLRRKQMGYYMDWIGPTILCSLVIAVLSLIMIVAFVDVFGYR